MNKSGSIILAAIPMILLTIAVVAANTGGHCIEDVWAKTVTEQSGAENPNNALGETDGNYTTISHTKTSEDYIIVEMEKEICNGPGTDVEVTFSTVSPYPDDVRVYASDSPSSGFAYLGRASTPFGTKSYDLGVLDCVKYIKLVNDRGHSYASEGAFIDSAKGRYTECQNDVPEFTTMGVVVAMAVIGLGIMFFRKKN